MPLHPPAQRRLVVRRGRIARSTALAAVLCLGLSACGGAPNDAPSSGAADVPASSAASPASAAQAGTSAAKDARGAGAAKGAKGATGTAKTTGGATNAMLEAARNAEAAAGAGQAKAPSADPTSEAPPKNAVPLDAVAESFPGRLDKPLLSQDMLVYSQDPLDPAVVEAISSAKGVRDVEQFSMAQFFVEQQPVLYASADPDTFRRYTPGATAQADDIWKRVADGEMVMRPALARRLQDAQGYVTIGNDTGAPAAHVGGLAPVAPDGFAVTVDAVVNEKWAGVLKMKQGNAVFVSTGSAAPQVVQGALKNITGDQASVQILGPNFDLSAAQTVVLSGGSVAQAVGTFDYTVNADGSVSPDAGWVSSHIRTEQMPIIGAVTGNSVMLPQLRGALEEVATRGLAAKLHPGEYGGCYVPRFIANTTKLSFHTFGTAIDFNVPANLRGTVGQMDRGVVQIFKKWGFDWGGDWRYTDPMHFELAQLVKTS